MVQEVSVSFLSSDNANISNAGHWQSPVAMCYHLRKVPFLHLYFTSLSRHHDWWHSTWAVAIPIIAWILHDFSCFWHWRYRAVWLQCRQHISSYLISMVSSAGPERSSQHQHLEFPHWVRLSSGFSIPARATYIICNVFSLVCPSDIFLFVVTFYR